MQCCASQMWFEKLLSARWSVLILAGSTRRLIQARYRGRYCVSIVGLGLQTSELLRSKHRRPYNGKIIDAKLDLNIVLPSHETHFDAIPYTSIVENGLRNFGLL